MVFEKFFFFSFYFRVKFIIFEIILIYLFFFDFLKKFILYILKIIKQYVNIRTILFNNYFF